MYLTGCCLQALIIGTILINPDPHHELDPEQLPGFAEWTADDASYHRALTDCIALTHVSGVQQFASKEAVWDKLTSLSGGDPEPSTPPRTPPAEHSPIPSTSTSRGPGRSRRTSASRSSRPSITTSSTPRRPGNQIIRPQLTRKVPFRGYAADIPERPLPVSPVHSGSSEAESDCDTESAFVTPLETRAPSVATSHGVYTCVCVYM